MPKRNYKPAGNISTWRDYQGGLKKAAAKKKLKKKVIIYSPVITVLLVAVYGIVAGLSGVSCRNNLPRYTSILKSYSTALKLDKEKLIEKETIRTAIGERSPLKLDRKVLDIEVKGKVLHAYTSLDMELQNYIIRHMDLNNSRYIGVVALEPASGRIVAMAGFDRNDVNRNPCVESYFPAASIFKIVTVAAGIEKCGFSPSSRFDFNGGKYTLYKSQLRNRVNKYTRRISLRDSFAQSVNPVFGKIGSIYLGKAPLEHYAALFGFNRPIDFEIPLSPSRVSLTDEAYQWAEVACGFNRKTLISPVHGALMSAVICNQGKFVEPTIIDRVTDEKGNITYRGHYTDAGQAILPETAVVLEKLMNATIQRGTARKIFRGYKRDKILSKLDIGGKTGSIMSRKVDHMRYDWFVGYAKEKHGDKQLALSVMVAHEKYIGKRAGWYAKIVMQHYFENRLETRTAKAHESKGVKRNG